MKVSIKDVIDFGRMKKSTAGFPVDYYDKRNGELLTLDSDFDFESSFRKAKSEKKRNQLKKYHEYKLMIENNPNLFVEVPEFDDIFDDDDHIELLFSRIEDKDKLALVKSYYSKKGIVDAYGFQWFLEKHSLRKLYNDILEEIYIVELIEWSISKGLGNIDIPDEYITMASFKGCLLNKCLLIKTDIAGDIIEYKFLVINDEAKKYEVIESIVDDNSLITTCSIYVANSLFDHIYRGLINEGYSPF